MSLKIKNIQTHLPKVFFGIIAIITSILLAKYLVADPIQTVLTVGILVLFYFLSRYEHIGLHFIILLPVIGELIRIPIASRELIISDIFIPIFIAVWIFKKITSEEKPVLKINQTKLYLPFLFFILIGFLSLIQALYFLSFSEVAGGSLYLLRFIQYGLLYFLVFQTIKNQKQANSLIRTIAISALLLATAGFIQLQIYPDLAELEEQGWDPHINRLVSTWLDPNFLGGFFAYTISILLGIAVHIKKVPKKIGLLFIISILGAALFLTYSRSAYIALLVGILVIGILKSRKLLIAIFIIFLLGISVSDRAQERVGELAQSTISIFSSVDTPDPTAKLRIQSWEQTLYLIQKRPLLGSGYNTLKYVNHNEGFIRDEDIHSASGSDSSLLTILATTGIIGFIPFVLILLFSIQTAYSSWKNKKQKGYSLGVLAGLLSLLIHSIFVNSLLFPPILISFWISLGILEWINKSPSDK